MLLADPDNVRHFFTGRMTPDLSKLNRATVGNVPDWRASVEVFATRLQKIEPAMISEMLAALR